MLNKLLKVNDLDSYPFVSLVLVAYMALGCIASFVAPTLINMIAFSIVTFLQYHLVKRYVAQMIKTYEVEEAANIVGAIKATSLFLSVLVYLMFVFVDF